MHPFQGLGQSLFHRTLNGGIYETNRIKKSQSISDEIYNLGVGVTATILSSLFNYVRNIKYATPSDIKCKSNFRIIYELVKNRNFKDLRIGWVTFQCGMGMVTGQLLYNNIHKAISQTNFFIP